MENEILILQDMNNKRMIAAFDMREYARYKGETMDYYYYYFGGYEHYISHLLKRGAVRCDDNMMSPEYAEFTHKIIPIYEIKEEKE